MSEIIYVIDIKLGNTCSILNMFKRLGVEALSTCDRDQIFEAKKLILPGVGAFDTAMQSLKDFNLRDVLEDTVINKKIPILGICLGMQILTEKSQEGVLSGLGWIKGETMKLNSNNVIKIPYMGWNEIICNEDNKLFNGLSNNSRFYFVHSYSVIPQNQKDIIAVTDYGSKIVAAIQSSNIYGVQFHPEKSHRFGMKLLKNFADL